MRRHTALVLAITAVQAAAADYRLEVPFIRQDREGCGSAAAAMVMRYWIAQGAPVDPESADPDTIQSRLYQPSAQGIHGTAMRGYLEQHGFSAYIINAELSDLEHHISRGRPLIVCLQERRSGPLHYVVVIGVDRDNGELLVHDPARGSAMHVKIGSFRKSWTAQGNWTLLAVPKS